MPLATIVPGARELISPRGQFTITLADERGRVKMRQVVENLVMTQLQEAIATQMRGQQNSGTGIGFDATGAQAIALDTDNAFATIGKTYPRCYAQHRQYLRGLYLSFNTVAPVANEWFPLGLIGGANSDTPYAGANTRRGTLNLPLAQRRPDGVRYVWDFGLDRCNGQVIASAGLAGITYPGEGPNLCYGWETYNYGSLGSGTGFPNGNTVTNSAVPISASKYWSFGPSGLTLIDLSLSTNWNQNSAACILLNGPTLATMAIGNGRQGGVAIIGSDMWVMDTLRLRRSIIPIDATYTALTTYSPVTGFTDPSCAGLCSDGTNLYALGISKVFVISPVTGAVTSSWAHGITTATGGGVSGIDGLGIWYDSITDCLWISGIREASTHNGTSAEGAYSEVASPGANPTPNTTPFKKDGTYMGLGTRPFWNGNSNSFVEFFWTMDGGRWQFDMGTNQGGQYAQNTTHGGCVGTRALLTTPFTKLATEVMRIQYDIAFSTPP